MKVAFKDESFAVDLVRNLGFMHYEVVYLRRAMAEEQ